MELNALTRWESIGKDLYARGKLGSEIERIKQFSKMLSAARKKHRQQQQQRGKEASSAVAARDENEEAEQSRLSGIAESKEEEEEAEGEEALNDVSPLPLLDAIEAAELAAANKQEERMQDQIEEEELDSIPPTHARVSTVHNTTAEVRHCHSHQRRGMSAVPCLTD